MEKWKKTVITRNGTIVAISFVFVVVLSGCHAPGASSGEPMVINKPAGFLKIILNGQEHTITHFVYSEGDGGGRMTLYASDTENSRYSPFPMWSVNAFVDTFDGNKIKGTVLYNVSATEAYVSSALQFSIDAWGGDEGDLLRGSFTGVMTHLVFSAGQYHEIENHLSLQGEFEDTQDL